MYLIVPVSRKLLPTILIERAVGSPTDIQTFGIKLRSYVDTISQPW